MSEDRPAGRSAADWVAGTLLAVLLFYVGFVHHGIGPLRDMLSVAWYEPRAYLHSWSSTAWLTESLRVGLVGFLLPAVALGLAVWFTTRSSLARLAAAWSVIAVALFCYYGIEAPLVWRFFHWRGSAVMALLALVLAVPLAAPWLAAAWMRLRWPWRLVVYLPAAFGVLVLMRDVTGTDPSLRFAISPWPVVPVFGLEGVVPIVCLVIAVVALARATLGRGLDATGLLGVSLVGLVVAVGLLAVGRSLELGLDWKLLALALALAAPVALQSAGAQAPGRDAALGVLLVAAPVLLGLGLVERDYTYTRDERAAEITQALARFAERHGEYPERLQDLVQERLLREVAEPRVGFGVLGQPGFVYQNFGISYLLEFSAPRWVQCAYNPPYADEDEEDYGDAEDGEALPGSWSCPSKPPQLW